MKHRLGFAAMPPERQRELASKGGKAAHRMGVGHEWTKEQAREMGRKGGFESAKRRAIKRLFPEWKT